MDRVVFLGTGAGTQGRIRNPSALCISLSTGNQILVDCGEGTSQQIMESQTVHFSKIDTVLITHLHGDHFFGLFGLLRTMR